MENWQVLNKNLFQVQVCALIFLWVNVIAFELITLLSWDLQNQFSVGYWPIMLLEILFINWELLLKRDIFIQFAFRCSFWNELFYANVFLEKATKNKQGMKVFWKIRVLKYITLTCYVERLKKYPLMSSVLEKLLDKGLIVIIGLFRRLALKLLSSLK